MIIYLDDIKNFFIKIKKQELSKYDKKQQLLLIETEWEKIHEASSEGFAFFLKYANSHFKESRHKEILLNLNEIGRFIEKENFFSLSEVPKKEIFLKQELIDGLYLVAKMALEEHRFKEAYYLFYILSVFCSKSFDVWLGLGISYQFLKQPTEAIAAFMEATTLNSHNCLPYLYIAESYLELGEWELAKKNGKKGLKLVNKDQNYILKSLENILILCEKLNRRKAA